MAAGTGSGSGGENKIDYQSKSFSVATSNNFAFGKKRVPGLDLSNLKPVKDYKDWYAYSKKLEEAMKLLREKISI